MLVSSQGSESTYVRRRRILDEQLRFLDEQWLTNSARVVALEFRMQRARGSARLGGSWALGQAVRGEGRSDGTTMTLPCVFWPASYL